MSLFRSRLETLRWAIVVGFLALVLGVGLFTKMALQTLERGLPTILLSQVEALTTVMDGLSELTHQAAILRLKADAAAMDSFQRRVNEVYGELVAVRNSFVLDNLIQASSFHAVVAPALVDVRQWLEHGVAGHGRESEVALAVVHSRLREAQARALAVRFESHGLVRTILEEQRSRLERFLVGVNLLLAAFALVLVLVLGLMWRQHRLWRREAAARAETARLIAIIESSREFISTATLDGRLTYVNRFGRSLVSWDENESLEGKRIDDLHPDRVMDILRSEAIPSALAGGTWTGETALLHRDGRKIPVMQTIMAHVGSKGKPEYLSTVMRDISERKAAEAERERLQDRLNQVQKLEALGTLAGGVAHDFNNILQAIGGYTQALLKDKAPASRDHARLKTIERSVERAAELIRRLLIFSRKAEAQRTLVDLNREIEDAVMVLTQTIPRMIEVTTDLEPCLWPIHADPIQIEQMLFNLSTNAADAMPQGGVLSLSTSNRILEEGEGPEDLPPGPYVRLTVADTGRGMSRRIMDKMFEPFFTTKEVGKGTGLGLASVYGIVTDHGGAIVCDSIIGRGTTFTIFLPADPTAVRPEPSTSPETQIFRSGRETILIVDDEADLRDLTMEALSDAGYEVLEAAGGEEALSVFEANQERVALVLLDLNMPGMGGHQCLLELLALNPKVRVIIASGYALNDQVRVSLEAGAAAFQGKPFKIGELLTLVREVLDRPSQ